MTSATRLLIVLALAATAPAAVRAQLSAPQPFVRVGEEMVFRVQSARFGSMGTAVLRVEGIDTVAGRPAYKLSFDFRTRIVLFNVSDRTRSWLDTETLTTLRYTKDERSPLGRREEAVAISTQDSTYVDQGVRRPLAATDPLDELAFIFLVRGIELDSPERFALHRHFDPARNPVQLCVLGRERVDALGTTRDALIVQMDVPDPRQGNGRSRLRFYISDDADRLVLRIDTSMPMAGAVTFTLAELRLPETER